MRITTRIAAAGGRSLTRIPMAHVQLSDCLNNENKIDRVKAQLAFAGCAEPGYQPFTPESSDDETVYFAALTFLDLMHDAYGKVCDDPNADCNGSVQNRQDERLEKKMDRGKFVYARQDVRRSADGVRVRLSVGNPHGIVGESEVEAKAYSATCCQLWLRIAKQIPWISVMADDDVISQAEKNNRIAELRSDNERRLSCERRMSGGYCSPICPTCKHYLNGMCVEVSE